MKEIVNPNVKVVIPVFNVENLIDIFFKGFPFKLFSEVILVDNNSTDNTRLLSEKYNVTCLTQTRKGYGHACQKALDYIISHDDQDTPDIVLFLDADFTDLNDEIYHFINPIIYDVSDLLVGSRYIGAQNKRGINLWQRFGNWMATTLIWFFHNVDFSDIGPVIAVRYDALINMKLKGKKYGFILEMQLKAARMNLRCAEVPLKNRPLLGRSKISGTFKGSLNELGTLLSTIFRNV
ncbi:MAG: glycosyltransferase family 2 protein [Cyclobacteriaceae bacterium]|nr:glycosyltransferase family 2 protein [Cyclobacteriaceae bacterium]